MKELELKEGQVTLFEREKASEKQPDYSGQLMLNGQRMDISLWKRTSKAGKDYLSGEVKEPYQRTVTTPERKFTREPEKPVMPEDIQDDNPVDDLPF